MIPLFNIPRYKIDMNSFSNVINDKIVDEFTQSFCDYVGAKYGCGFCSATNAIFLAMLNKNQEVTIPTLLPHVVLNALLLSNNKVNFRDDVEWIGDSYTLHQFDDYKIIDSAQKVEKDQFKKEAKENDLMLFSFYPTKPVGSVDGGIIVSNDKNKIEWFKQAVNNGARHASNNWEKKIEFPGWKMYLNTIQAKIAFENLKKLDKKQKIISEIREEYNEAFGLKNKSNHLYRINVNNRDSFIEKMRSNGVTCGIHYHPLHLENAYKNHPLVSVGNNLKISEADSLSTATLPLHEKLTKKDIKKIIKSTLEARKECL